MITPSIGDIQFPNAGCPFACDAKLHELLTKEGCGAGDSACQHKVEQQFKKYHPGLVAECAEKCNTDEEKGDC